jgi:hypothetical protein
MFAITFFTSCESNPGNHVEDKATLEDVRRKNLQENPDKNNLQKKYDAVLLKLDSLTAYNEELTNKHSADISKITKTKAEVHRLLLIDKLTVDEKLKAESLISAMDSVLNKIIVNK